ncbi:[Myosin heavy-chain] kinase [Bertholletia excelsa]
MYMVCANCRTTFQEKFGDWSNECVGANESTGVFNMVNFAMIGMEICEAVCGLHSEGLLCGGLSITCFTFNDFGHVYINLNEVLAMGRRIRTTVGGTAQDALKSKELEVSLRNYALDELAFISPELLLELFQKDVTEIECGKKFEVEYGSDVWSLACVLLWLLLGNPFIERIYSELLYLITVSSNDEGSDYMGSCKDWKEKVMTSLKCKLGSDFVPLLAILCECLNFNPGSRPPLIDLWKCTRELVTKTKFNLVDGLAEMGKRETTRHCLVLGEMCRVQDGNRLSERKLVNDAQEEDDNIGGDVDQARELRVDRDVIEGISKSQIKFDELKGHLDCITGLTVGGGFLFSSSLDKTVQVWSLQDLTHVHTFKGHEYKVMALVFVDKEQPLCISGDSGGGIHIWDVTYPFGEEPIKKLYEQKDWRYSGIHALTISGTEYLYTGSGDKSVKAWSLQDYTLSSVMHGHKSVVSTLAACSGVLYSGSWDGTIRLWSLNDHSPLAILGEDAPGKLASVLALAAYGDALLVAHENGCIKIWRNNAVMKSTQNHNGQIFSICMEDRWLFTGGWDKVVNVQELLGDEFQTEVFPIGSIACDSVVTALLYWHGKLFVGQADRIIKVYYYGS